MLDFIQDQVLGMQWFNLLIGEMLTRLGINTSGRAGGSLQFFLFDTFKITALLLVLIFLISYIQSYFPPERSRKIMGRFHGAAANSIAALLGSCNAFLQLLVYPDLHRLHEGRPAAWSDFFLSHIITNGGSWQSGSPDWSFRA